MAAPNPFQAPGQVEAIMDTLGIYERGSDEYRACVVLLAANSRGANAEDLIQFTGYEAGFIHTVERHCRQSGLWIQEETFHEWWADDGAMNLALDVQVALGQLERRRVPPDLKVVSSE